MLMMGTLVVWLAGTAPAGADTSAAREFLQGSSDSSVVAPASPAFAPPKRAPTAAELKALRRSVEKQELFRLEGHFGGFEAHAGKVTATGFEQLEENVAHPGRDSPRALTWGQIDRVDVKRSGTEQGAGKGMLIGCAIVVVTADSRITRTSSTGRTT